ncbi:hypothetical protein ACPV5G_20885, partial [Photobacterium damselae]|uniref:hypothetical protein n=1 Tax=Photobacterium damselae TaxID=38293 RepID=UPI004068B756
MDNILESTDTVQAQEDMCADNLLEAFINAYNQQNVDWDNMVIENQKLSQQLNGYKRQCTTQQEEIDYLNKENDTLCEIAKGADKLVTQAKAQKHELVIAKNQIKQLQQTIKDLKKDNPDKMKVRIKRQMEKALEANAKITRLEKDAKQYRQELKEKRTQLQSAFGKINELNTELLHNTGSGLYHNGTHHLIIWPQHTTLEDMNGEQFSGRALLYLHESGRAGIMSYNPKTEEVNLCQAPRGGLRPSEEAR